MIKVDGIRSKRQNEREKERAREGEREREKYVLERKSDGGK